MGVVLPEFPVNNIKASHIANRISKKTYLPNVFFIQLAPIREVVARISNASRLHGPSNQLLAFSMDSIDMASCLVVCNACCV